MPCRGPGQRADRCLDVRCIHTPHAQRRTDHLGYFPANVGAAVRSHKLWQWRQDRYSELVDLALDRVVDAKEDTEINGLYLCKSGNHRSVLWALVEGWIMILLGAFAREVPICWWAQDRVKCQGEKDGCRYCGPLAPELKPIRKEVVDEFVAFLATSPV